MAAIRNLGRRMSTCHHEAGHILTYWYFGFPVDCATVLTVAEVLEGTKIKGADGTLLNVEGLVQVDNICRPPFGPIDCFGPDDKVKLFHSNRARRRDVVLVALLAGIKAEAIYRRTSFAECMLRGGTSDMERFGRIISGWYPDEAHHRGVERVAEHRAAALLRSLNGAVAIAGLAHALFERGRIRERTICSICRRAFQGRQVRDFHWDDHWPPTIKQIREGFLPTIGSLLSENR